MGGYVKESHGWTWNLEKSEVMCLRREWSWKYEERRNVEIVGSILQLRQYQRRRNKANTFGLWLLPWTTCCASFMHWLGKAALRMNAGTLCSFTNRWHYQRPIQSSTPAEEASRRNEGGPAQDRRPTSHTWRERTCACFLVGRSDWGGSRWPGVEVLYPPLMRQTEETPRRRWAVLLTGSCSGTQSLPVGRKDTARGWCVKWNLWGAVKVTNNNVLNYNTPNTHYQPNSEICTKPADRSSTGRIGRAQLAHRTQWISGTLSPRVDIFKVEKDWGLKEVMLERSWHQRRSAKTILNGRTGLMGLRA